MSEDTAQPAAHVYSQRLGALTPQQFQAALTRFGLGTFVGATAVAQGLFAQNVFVQSTQGDYVLRGVPHYPWQFRLDIARALGQNLFHLHQLTWPFAGAYDHTSDTIQPFGEGFAAWIVADIRQWLAAARANGRTTTDDIAR